ncbi:sensor histidine kinase [Neptunitalea chrysea]|uniref:histidine kinase n=1 Tax=Neptunitalea chrysea TaxID=1647581 RepID=A0A9W6B806_9FLAO|nr:substrate-binding domain-containing protein [Neptunitalea chrysea]GLB53582.1 sensor histidine kinase [Neptunitalea chrysea]
MGEIKKGYLKVFGMILGCLGLCIGCQSGSDRQEKDHIRIGFSQAMTTDEWRQQMDKSMKIEASLHPEVELMIADAHNDVATQIQDIQSLLDSDINVLIVSPIASEPITPIVKKAYKKGIPVLIVDRKIEGESYTAYLGADNIEIGRTAANYIVANQSGSGKIIEITGLKESSPAYERGLGFSQIIRDYPKVSVVATIDGDWEKGSVKEPLKKILAEFPDVEYVYAQNDRMALGAWEVAQSMGLEHQLKFVGVDGLNTPNGGIQLVKKGMLEATVLYPTGGNEALKLALQMYQGETVPRRNLLNSIIINKMNAELMENQMDKIDQQQYIIDSQQQAIRVQEAQYTTQRNLLFGLLFFCLGSIGLAAYSIYSTVFIKKKKKELELNNQTILQQKEELEVVTEKLQVSHRARSDFFTGMSHEFKTPLTLILGYTEALLQNPKLKDLHMVSDIRQVYYNSNRLYRLINQLLDFRKIEEQKLKLNVAEIELKPFLNQLSKFFATEALKRHIDFECSCEPETLVLHADRDYLDKIFFNLLSNAFKFTPDNGCITVQVQQIAGSEIVIRFRDSGIGIPESELSKVFQPFFQASNNHRNSSGIGLYLVKEYMELHGGRAAVHSKHGTEFVLHFLAGDAALPITTSGYQSVVGSLEGLMEGMAPLDITEGQPSPKILSSQERYTLLVIEDNRELVTFLENKLQDEFEVLVSDGSDALSKAQEEIPDVILCDVSLQYTNGFDISKQLKQDLRTSHIPILILSAFSNHESVLQGLESGIDMYLTKPFNFSVLRQSLHTVLFNREKLRYYFTHNIYKIQDNDAEFNSSEQKFLTKMNELIEANFENPDFTVESLAEALNVSRVQLYRKVKALLGHSISDHMNEMKLESAKVWLAAGKMNISEVAYKLGFSSPNYFSTTFKAKYGVSPREFQIQLRSTQH